MPPGEQVTVASTHTHTHTHLRASPLVREQPPDGDRRPPAHMGVDLVVENRAGCRPNNRRGAITATTSAATATATATGAGAGTTHQRRDRVLTASFDARRDRLPAAAYPRLTGGLLGARLRLGRRQPGLQEKQEAGFLPA